MRTDKLTAKLQSALGDAQSLAVGRNHQFIEVGTHFRPEFLNRVDDMVVFHPLQQEQLKSIAKIQIQRLADRLEQRNIKLDVSVDALNKLAQIGFDPVYGARPLKRVIQTQIENRLAHEILSGIYLAGDVITVTVVDDDLVFGHAHK